MPRRNDCLCAPGTPCGFREVQSSQVRPLRAAGAVVRNGLDNKLDGWWVRECQLRAFEAAQALAKGGTNSGVLIKIHRKAEGYVVMQYRYDKMRETPERRLAVRKNFDDAKAFVEENFISIARIDAGLEPLFDDDPSVVAIWG